MVGILNALFFSTRLNVSNTCLFLLYFAENILTLSVNTTSYKPIYLNTLASKEGLVHMSHRDIQKAAGLFAKHVKKQRILSK